MSRNRLTGGLTRGGAATAGVAAVGLLLAGCNPGGEGVRPEGSATSTPSPKGALSASPSPATTAGSKKVPGVKLLVKQLKDDPTVGAEVKKTLAKPCSGNEYPVDASPARLTGSGSPDVIVNVMTCADSTGIGAYVFRKRDSGDYATVYRNESPLVFAGDNDGELEVTQQTYDADDDVCCPSGEDVREYRWSKDRFTEYKRFHRSYSKATDDSSAPPDGTDPEG